MLKKTVLLLFINYLLFSALYAYPPKDIRLPYNAELVVASQYFKKAKIFYDSAAYDSALQCYQKSLKIWLKVLGEEHPNIAVSYIGIGVISYEQWDYTHALECYQKALKIQLKVLGEDHSHVAISYANTGNVYRDQGNYNFSLEYYQKALKIWLKVFGEDHPNVAFGYNYVGNIYHMQGDYSRALEYYQKALKIRLMVLGNDHPDLKTSYNNLGVIYDEQGNYTRALEYYQKSLKIWLKFFGKNHLGTAQTYNNLGIVYLEQGNYTRAPEYFQEALTVFLKVLGEDNPNTAQIYHNLGFIYYNQENYTRALEYYQKSLKTRLKIFGKDHPVTSQSYQNIGIVYSDQGNYTRALGYMQVVLKIQLKVLGKDHPNTASVYHNIGSTYEWQENYSRALEYYQKSLKIRLKVFGKDHPMTAQSYHNIGFSYGEQGDYTRALEYHQKSLKAFLKALGGYHHFIANVYRNIARVYSIQDNYNQALKYHQKSFTALSKGFDYLDIYINPSLKIINSKTEMLRNLKSKSYLAEKLYEKTKKQKDLDLAFRTARLAADLIDSMRNEYEDKEAQQHITEESLSSVYETGIRTALQLHRLTDKQDYLQKVFNLAERSKSYLLFQSLKDSEAKSFAGLSDSLLDLEHELKIQINFYEKNLLEAENQNDSVKTAMYQNYLFDKKRSYDSLIKAFETDYPDYYRLKYDTRTASVEDIQKTITDEHTALLEYFAGDSAMYVFTITQDTVHVEEIPNPAEIKKDISELLSLIKNHPQSLSDYQKVKENQQKRIKISRSLYDRLLASSLSKINKNITKLVIIPDGMLNYLPFEALMTSGTKKQRYILEDYAISYGYSATLLSEKIKTSHREPAEGEVLALAPRYPGSSKKLAVRGEISTLRNQPLSDLPGARREIQSISRYFDGEYLFGEAANEQNFKENAPHYRILHLAMHGQATTGSELNAKLLFTPSKNKTEDDTLYNYELYGMKLNADLIVLSACETGTGDLLKGEGVMSLARGFMYAGARSVVSSLWQTGDESSSKLMSYFYEQLSKGQPKDEALQEAKKRYLQETKGSNDHPYFWAAFIPIGDMKPIKPVQNKDWIILSFIGALILSIGFFVLKREKKEK